MISLAVFQSDAVYRKRITKYKNCGDKTRYKEEKNSSYSMRGDYPTF